MRNPAVGAKPRPDRADYPKLRANGAGQAAIQRQPDWDSFEAPDRRGFGQPGPSQFCNGLQHFRGLAVRQTPWNNPMKPKGFGAAEKTRTSTGFRPQRPQRCASTSSATAARETPPVNPDSWQAAASSKALAGTQARIAPRSNQPTGALVKLKSSRLELFGTSSCMLWKSSDPRGSSVRRSGVIVQL